MELINKNNDSFDPTPRLKTSPVPAFFIPFKINEEKCNYCENKYSETLEFKQKYLISTKNIQEWCEYCSEVLYFRQIVSNDLLFKFNRKTYCDYCNYCNLCGKLITDLILNYVCPDCYLVSYELVEPNLTIISSQNFLNISIIHLPWWDNYDKCRICYLELKYLTDCQKIKYFLNEIKSLCHTSKFFVIGCRGITQDPVTEDYMIIMTYANGGNLHGYLQKNFVNITWPNKVKILLDISLGLQNIHENNYIHRDLHSGNILLLYKRWRIGDLGLSQPAENTSLNNEIYGKLGPEFSQKSHPKAIFTSRALNSWISKSSTINSSTIMHSIKQEHYITKENDFDIDINTQRLSSSNIQESSLNNQHSNAIYTISKPISTVNSSRKRNFEELKIETQNIGKHVKIDN
ncbi:kinase-like domain-containing protein [Rhizophagus irregularis DAOM 181602=DAOM 197198]|nr:kinase-like domain-containing protein [Rhizophagus irregularis DAOM 181602=DAOM 197198]